MERRYCTCCTRKFYTKHLQRLYYPLLKKYHWHCNYCLSAFGDNLQFATGQKQKYLLELFSGSKTVSGVAEQEFNYRTFTIDIDPDYSPALCTDISKLSIKQIPDSGRVFALWASVPCTYFTILNISDHWQKITYSHRHYLYLPISPEAKQAIQLLEKTIWLIRKLNPVYYFIENPRGALRHFAQMNFAPFRYTISYNDFGSDVYKPTDIFTNCKLEMPAIRGAMGRTFPGSVVKIKSSYDRAIVPEGVARSILQQVEKRHYSNGKSSSGSKSLL